MKTLSRIILAVFLFAMVAQPIYLAYAADDAAVAQGAAAGVAVGTAAGVAGLNATLYVAGTAIGPVGWVLVAALVVYSLFADDLFGGGGPENPQEAIEECIKRPTDQTELDEIQRVKEERGMSNDQIISAICNSPETRNLMEGPNADDHEPLIEEFLWTPQSEGDGNALVLLPASYTGKVIAAAIMNGQTVVEIGTYTGDYQNGGRTHFRFTKPGGSYGSNFTVAAATQTGNCSWAIPNGAKEIKGTSCNKQNLNSEDSDLMANAQCNISKTTVAKEEVVTLDVKLDDTDQNNYTFAWSGTGLNKNTQKVQISYSYPGTFNNSVTITDRSGKKETIQCNPITVTNTVLENGGELDAVCKISDKTPAIDADVDLWAEISGGKSPYTIQWTGDTKNISGLDKEKNDQIVRFDKKGSYKLKFTVKDSDGKRVQDSCSTIKVTSKGVEDDVLVKTENTNNANNNTNVSTGNTSSYPFSRDLTVGSTGADVTALQEFLVAQGFLVMPAGVNYGYFGELTRVALANWQAARGITPSVGYFGAKTRAAISGGYVAPVSTYTAPQPAPVVQASNQNRNSVSCVDITGPIYRGEENQNISKVQQFLVATGYLVMPIGTSYGYYGPSTASAISNFMTVQGAQRNGEIMDSVVLGEIKKVSCGI